MVSFNITLSDSNDNSPQFRPVTTAAHIKESADVGDVVLRVNATERDQGINVRLVYRIVAGDPARHFSIDNQTVRIDNQMVRIDNQTVGRSRVTILFPSV